MLLDDPSIQVTTLGPDDEEPELAVVGGIHGDEPAGVRAVRTVLETEPALERPVKFVLANPAAAEAHRRYLDTDMNRTFPGDADADAKEDRLAAQLVDELEDCLVLSIHTTHSCDDPIAFVERTNEHSTTLAANLPVPYVVDEYDTADGAFVHHADVVSVEAGKQLSDDATENAIDLVRAFLRRTDALPDDPPECDPDFYSMREPVDKPEEKDEYELLVDNFSQVDAGETYAEAGDEELEADEPFVPILMSECGYEERFGYRGEQVGETLEEARESWESR
ncbi:succinylglutamate desuccinylase [Haloarchaeobius sp. TZWWS8]|uniref:succinylglutamate desuccinylase n=1 Tax=Haloarchaeobius sp. TZWWS8 TaxID=3446121 RepID=UPI003EBE2ED9